MPQLSNYLFFIILPAGALGSYVTIHYVSRDHAAPCICAPATAATVSP
jgi:hypothetical protein